MFMVEIVVCFLFSFGHLLSVVTKSSSLQCNDNDATTETL